MAIVRINGNSDAVWCRSWSVADAAERATLMSGISTPLGPKRGDTIFQVDTSTWYLLLGGSNLAKLSGLVDQNPWVAIPYNAGDFTGSGTIVWTVDVGDLLTFEYQEINDYTNLLAITVQGATIAGAGNQLTIALPFTPISAMAGPLLLADAGLVEVGFYSITAGIAAIDFFRQGLPNWTATVNGQSIYIPPTPVRIA